MGEIREMRNDIAASLYIIPCTLEVLMEREFMKNKSVYGIQLLIRELERVEALFYKGDTMHIKKKWAKKNLQEYDIDFRTEKQKFLDGLSDFARQVYGV